MLKSQVLPVIAVVLVLTFSPYAQSAQLNFTPVLTVSEAYTDNLFLTPNSEKDDYITTVTLGGTLEWLGRTAGLELTYLPSYEWYNDYSEFDGWNQDLLDNLVQLHCQHQYRIEKCLYSNKGHFREPTMQAQPPPILW